jgi:hypothetical protein
MARVSVAAAFVQAKMPIGNSGTLNDQDAYDIAAYFTAQPRPTFGSAANVDARIFHLLHIGQDQLALSKSRSGDAINLYATSFVRLAALIARLSRARLLLALTHLMEPEIA